MKWIKRVKNNTLPHQLANIGHLMEQGYPIDSALTFIKLHINNEDRKKIASIQQKLRNGMTVHESFLEMDIPNDILSFLYFYEKRGELGLGFIQAGAIYAKKEKTKKELRKILRYPIILSWLCVVIVLLMHQFIVPHFKTLFSTFTTEPPLLTKVVFAFLQYLPLFTVLFTAGFLLMLIYYLKVIKKWEPKRKVDALLAIPLCRKITKQILTYYFSLQFGRLLSAGVSLQHALSIFEEQEYLRFFQLEATRFKKELKAGEGFHQVVKTRHYFLRQLVFVIENGVRTGNLGNDLQYYSDKVFQEMEEMLQKVSSFLQPIFFLLVGGIIFLLFLSIMLPMFQMLGTLH